MVHGDSDIRSRTPEVVCACVVLQGIGIRAYLKTRTLPRIAASMPAKWKSEAVLALGIIRFKRRISFSAYISLPFAVIVHVIQSSTSVSIHEVNQSKTADAHRHTSTWRGTSLNGFTQAYAFYHPWQCSFKEFGLERLFYEQN